jgi:hypothetical protein
MNSGQEKDQDAGSDIFANRAAGRNPKLDTVAV